jgi:protein SDA1
MTTSASLRSLIQTTILQDIKAQNRKSLNHRLNRVVQGLLFAVVERGMPSRDAPQPHAAHARGEIKSRSEALWAVRLAADLWRKNIWKDAKTVSLIALACFHPHPKVQSSAVRFFLGDLHHAENGESSDSDSEEEAAIPDVNKMQHARKVNKKTRGGDRKVRQAAAVARKRRREAQDGREEVAEGDGRANFAALYLLNDPQGFGERLFENLSKGDRKMGIELKVRVMQLLSRVMGAHKCCILSFYSYVVKWVLLSFAFVWHAVADAAFCRRYLNPHQVHITLILVSLAQSVHSQTPPDALQPVLRKLSDAFVHPGVGPEVVAAGINSIRETCRRQPWAMEKELLADLVGYRKSKDKGVGAAARGLLQLYREVNPALLARSERGKSGALSVAEGKAPKAFGEEDEGQVGIPGLALLEKHLEEHEGEEDEDPEEAERKAWAGWEEDSDDDSDSSGGWIDVSSDEGGDDAFDVEDSDEEKDKADENKDKRSIKERLAARRERRREQRRREKSGEATAELDDDEASQADSEEGGEGEQSEAAKVAESAAAAEQEFSKLATTRVSWVLLFAASLWLDSHLRPRSSRQQTSPRWPSCASPPPRRPPPRAGAWAPMRSAKSSRSRRRASAPRRPRLPRPMASFSTKRRSWGRARRERPTMRREWPALPRAARAE